LTDVKKYFKDDPDDFLEGEGNNREI